MRQLKISGVIFLLMSTFLLSGSFNLKRIDQWKFDETFNRHFYSLIDRDNRLLAVFYKSSICIITRDRIVKFGSFGQGPSELTGLQALFNYNDGCIAALEYPDKLKVFKKEADTYVWKETKWLKRGKYAHFVRNGIFFDDKFFFAGYETVDSKGSEVYFLRVLDANGNLLKQLIKKRVESPIQFQNMKYYIEGYKTDKVFFLAENELKVVVVSTKTLEIIKEVQLETPNFYKKMPKDFYIFKKYDNPRDNFQLDIENWAVGYSRISNCIVDSDYLVLQIRTCSDKLKNYAILLYNAGTFKLESTIFIDDFLLGVKDGKYYFFAKGEPGRDHESEESIINIYTIEKEK